MKKIAEANAKEIMAAYVAMLRSVAIIHQNNHWQCSGPNFYSNHLMFERLYKEASEQSDALAEKSIELFGIDVLDLKKQAGLIKTLVSIYAHGGSSDNETALSNSIEAEKDFIKLSSNVIQQLNKFKALSPGLEDLINGLMSDSENRIYLLKQAGW